METACILPERRLRSSCSTTSGPYMTRRGDCRLLATEEAVLPPPFGSIQSTCILCLGKTQSENTGMMGHVFKTTHHHTWSGAVVGAMASLTGLRWHPHPRIRVARDERERIAALSGWGERPRLGPFRSSDCRLAVDVHDPIVARRSMPKLQLRLRELIALCARGAAGCLKCF